MWQFLGFFGEIGQYLVEMVTGKFSDKMRLENPTVKMYVHKRSEIERDLIRNGINWHSFFESCDFMRLPTEEDKEFVKTLSNGDLLDMLHIMILALKGYIDAFEETSLNCEILHEFYLLLKKEIELRPNLSFMPKGDGGTLVKCAFFANPQTYGLTVQCGFVLIAIGHLGKGNNLIN